MGDIETAAPVATVERGSTTQICPSCISALSAAQIYGPRALRKGFCPICLTDLRQKAEQSDG